MEPNKMENEFKKKLENRTIQPSNMAWDRLDAMLTVAEKKKKPWRTWMYVAASFLGFILIGTLFLNQNKPNETIKSNDNTVVTAPDVKKAISPAEETLELPKIVKEVTARKKIQRTEVAAISPQKPLHKAETIKYNEPFVQQQEAVANNINSIIGEKPVSAEEEAASLLSASLNKRAKKKAGLNVSSNSLLTSAEGELNESFRSKVLQSVNKNYNAIKTSVANRNKE